MRPLAVWALLLAVAVVTGCDSDQPLQAPPRNAVLEFKASGTFTTSYRVFEMFEDTQGPVCPTGPTLPQGDGVPDYGTFPWCDGRGTLTNPYSSPSSVPWPFQVVVKVIPADQTEPIEVVSASVIAPYDSNVTVGGGLPSSGGVASVLHRRGTCTGNLARVCNPQSVGSTFCASLGEGTCVEATGYCSLDSSLHCRDDAHCAAFGVGVCFDNPAGTCSGNSCLRCDPDALSGDDGFTVCADASAGSCVADSACSQGIPCLVQRVFKWNQGYSQVTAANKYYLEQIAGSFPVLYDQARALATQLDPQPGHPDSAEPRNGGRCPIFRSAQPAAIAPLELQLNPGDTITVAARSGSVPPPQVNFNPLANEPNLSASFSVDGQSVTVQGSTVQLGTSSEDFIDFFFTAQ